ncbi:MAG: hypothetical protein OXK73_06975 [Rhodospirillaceae bacterium]|nr:hypothetical protein [Rhodospirillaceae bacterium]
MDITAANIEAALGTLRNLPTPVSGWEVETGIDSTDKPAVWVWGYLTDEEVDFETRSRLRDMVRDLVRRETESAIWVYVRFRGASEVALVS